MPKTQSDPQLRTHATEFLRSTVRLYGNNLASRSTKNLIDILESQVRASSRKIQTEARGCGDDDDYDDDDGCDDDDDCDDNDEY